MSETGRFFARALLKPWRQRELFLEFKERKPLRKTLLLLVFIGLALSLTSLIQAACGHFPAVPIILPFDLENYFVWQAALAIPWIIFCWLTVSVLTGLMLGVIAGRSSRVRWKEMLILSGLALADFLFVIWLMHLLTAVFYLLGMSQKEWVDLLSEPGWFQTLYLTLLIVAFFTGWLAMNFNLVKSKYAGKAVSFLAANFGYSVALVLLAAFLR